MPRKRPKKWQKDKNKNKNKKADHGGPLSSSILCRRSTKDHSSHHREPPRERARPAPGLTPQEPGLGGALCWMAVGRRADPKSFLGRRFREGDRHKTLEGNGLFKEAWGEGPSRLCAAARQLGGRSGLAALSLEGVLGSAAVPPCTGGRGLHTPSHARRMGWNERPAGFILLFCT